MESQKPSKKPQKSLYLLAVRVRIRQLGTEAGSRVAHADLRDVHAAGLARGGTPPLEGYMKNHVKNQMKPC